MKLIIGTLLLVASILAGADSSNNNTVFLSGESNDFPRLIHSIVSNSKFPTFYAKVEMDNTPSVNSPPTLWIGLYSTKKTPDEKGFGERYHSSRKSPEAYVTIDDNECNGSFSTRFNYNLRKPPLKIYYFDNPINWDSPIKIKLVSLGKVKRKYQYELNINNEKFIFIQKKRVQQIVFFPNRGSATITDSQVINKDKI